MDKNTSLQSQQPQQIPPQTIFNPEYGYLSYPAPPPPPRYVPPPAPGVTSTAALAPTEQQVPNYQQLQVLNQSHQQTQGQNPQHSQSAATQEGAVPEKKDNGAKQQTTGVSQTEHTTAFQTSSQPQTTSPVQNRTQAQPNFHNQCLGYNYGQPSTSQPPIRPLIPNNQPNNQQPYNQPPNYQAYSHQHHETVGNQTGFYSGHIVPNFPPPNTAWNPYQQPGYCSNAHQFAPSGSYSQIYPTTSVNTVVNQTSVSAAATTSQYLESSAGGVGYTTSNYRMGDNGPTSNVTSGLAPSSSGLVGTTPAYTPQAATGQNVMTPTNNQQGYTQTTFNSQTNQPYVPVATTSGQSQGTSAGGVNYTTSDYRMEENRPNLNATSGVVPSSSGFMGMTPYTPQASTSHNWMTPTNTSSGYPQSTCNTQTTVNFFSGEGNERAMFATEIRKQDDEERRRAIAIYENERLQSLYLSEGIRKRLVINPNVNIEAQVNQEYLHQCLQGLNPDGRTMERMYGSVNINAAGQTHNFSNIAVTNTRDSSGGFLTTGSAHAIQHESYMRPPPPYPQPVVNRLAIDSARNEARNAEAELSASKERRKQAEENIVAKEAGKRKLKAKSQRMSANERLGYLRYQYSGRTTRNTSNYMNTSDEGLEEYIMQLELEEARNAERVASEKMKAANMKLKAQLEEASRIQAAQIPHPPPPYGQNFNPVGGPMRQPANRRGRRPQSYQSNCQRSTAPGHEYVNPSAIQPPPSYPDTSRDSSRSQHYAPYQMPTMGRNPPDYYQAVGSSTSEFRTQHPRQTATYGPGRKPNASALCANHNQQYTTATPQAPRRQVIREIPQMSAPMVGSQQYHCGPQGNKYSSANAHPASRGQNSQIPHNPSNLYKPPTGYPLRQTRSSTRMFGEACLAGQDNRTPTRASSVSENRPMPNPTAPPYFPTQMASTASGSGQSSNQPVSTPSDVMSAAVTQPMAGVTSASKTHSEQPNANDVDNIENLVPTLPAIPNMIFERCLKEMTPEVPKENQRNTSRMEAKVHCNAPFPSSSSSMRPSLPTVGGRVQTQGASSGLRAPGPSTTHPYGRRETRSTTRNQNNTSIESSIEKELDEYFEQHAKDLQQRIVEDDFSSEVEELLK